MQVEFINPFVTATCNVFRTMLQCELVRGRLVLKRNHTPAYEVSGLNSDSRVSTKGPLYSASAVKQPSMPLKYYLAIFPQHFRKQFVMPLVS